MSAVIPIPEGFKPYSYSVVGTMEEGDVAVLVNAYGTVMAAHPEYARRIAIKRFKISFPRAKTEMFGVLEINPNNMKAEAV